MEVPDPLTRFQRSVLEAFFSLPESHGYVLAGGAGLLAARLSTRPTDDVDLFGSDLQAGVEAAGDALEAVCVERSWHVERVRDAPTFRRLALADGEDELIVDLAIDSPPLHSIHLTDVGPTFELHELAARKLLALFDRAAARDFADLLALSGRFDVDELLTLARELDDGFDIAIFASMLDALDRFSDEDLAATGAEPGDLRRFVAELADRLRSAS